jgi:hypothetical protein
MVDSIPNDEVISLSCNTEAYCEGQFALESFNEQCHYFSSFLCIRHERLSLVSIECFTIFRVHSSLERVLNIPSLSALILSTTEGVGPEPDHRSWRHIAHNWAILRYRDLLLGYYLILWLDVLLNLDDRISLGH